LIARKKFAVNCLTETITNADKILFLENGEIKEAGTHSELMQLNGSYAKMYRIQSEKYT
jgi:ABC-type multidrug transport system fused ATPase/permease subunit